MRPAGDREVRKQASRLLRLRKRDGLAVPPDGEGSQDLDLKRGDAHADEGAFAGAVRQIPLCARESEASWYSRRVEWVILEREFPEPLTPEVVVEMAQETTCLEIYRVKPVRSYLMDGGRKMVCVFEAPDAEALRAVARANEFPPGSIWASTLHTP